MEPLVLKGKICHVCLCASAYNDGFSYQDNLLPYFHKRMGYEVCRFLNRHTFQDGVIVHDSRSEGEYVDQDDIKNYVFHSNRKSFFSKVLNYYPGVYKRLEQIKPDIIFVHSTQTISILSIIRYKKKHPNVLLFADHHGDYFNMPISGCNWKVKLGNKYLAAFFARRISGYVERYWGVTPWRVEYLQQVYKISPQKTDLLLLGADDRFLEGDTQNIRAEFKVHYGLSESDFIITTGGKIDKSKNIIELMRAVASMPNKNVKLFVFGKVLADVATEFESLLTQNDRIFHLGWLNDRQTMELFRSSDLIVFPGTHSVLWEQVVACGIPAVYKYWKGMQHIDIGGNCRFLEEVTEDSLRQVILEITENQQVYQQMQASALGIGRKEFLYSNIARKSILLDR